MILGFFFLLLTSVQCFDVPVLHITQEGQTKPIKFMHRLDEKKVIEAINKNNNDSPKKL